MKLASRIFSLRALLAVPTTLLLAGCDSLLVDPAAAPETSTISFALSPSSGTHLGFEDADRARVQVRGETGLLLDSIVRFAPGSPQFLVPVEFNGSSTTADVFVELRREFLPLLRGNATAQLRAGRVNDVAFDLGSPVPVSLAPVNAISAGVYHSCTTTEGPTYCWGLNEDLQLGSGASDFSTLPVAMDGDTPSFSSISTGYVSSCGLTDGGEAYCWGRNLRGSLGAGSTADETSDPVQIGGQLRFTSISVGGLHGCALTAEGVAYCWGFNEFGQVGDATTTDRATPVRVSTSLRFQSLDAGYVHTCGIALSGIAYCWGLNEFGQLGDGFQEDRAVPTPVSAEQPFLEISAGGLHTCATARDQTVFCWGYNHFGQLGIGSQESQMIPTPLPESIRLSGVSAGGLHTCGIGEELGTLCWGYNRSGAVGDGTSTTRESPTPVLTGGVSLRAVSAGLHHTCATTSDGRPACWGYNQFGQVGDGSTVNRHEPEEVLAIEAFLTEALPEGGVLTDRIQDLLAGRVQP